MKYIVRTKVDQIVTKEVEVVVTASNEDQAVSKVHEVLQDFPNKGAVDIPGVSNVLALKAHYWIPRDITIVSITEEKSVA